MYPCPAANCLRRPSAWMTSDAGKTPNTPATHPFYRRAHSSRAKVSRSRATRNCTACPVLHRALQPIAGPHRFAPARFPRNFQWRGITAEKNQLRNKDPGCPAAIISVIDKFTFPFPGGAFPGISRCDESRLSIVHSCAHRISHVPRFCGVRPQPTQTPARGSFAWTRLRNFKSASRAAPAADSAVARQTLSALFCLRAQFQDVRHLRSPTSRSKAW